MGNLVSDQYPDGRTKCIMLQGQFVRTIKMCLCIYIDPPELKDCTILAVAHAVLIGFKATLQICDSDFQKCNCCVDIMSRPK